jgi:valyl-tRNA synthetase
LISQFEDVKEVVTNLRNIRKNREIPPRERLKLLVRKSSGGEYPARFDPVIVKLAHLSDVEVIREDPGDTVSFIVKNVEYFVPVGSLLNKADEIAKLEAELDYTRGFLESVQKKLNNEQFVRNAPGAVVEKEQQKLDDARAKIGVLTATLGRLKS